MDNEAQTVIFVTTLGDKEYEIKSTLPSWDLTQYMISQYAELEKGKLTKETIAICNEIATKCFKKWRVGNNGEWSQDIGILPGAVLLSYVGALVFQSGMKAETKIRSEKN